MSEERPNLTIDQELGKLTSARAQQEMSQEARETGKSVKSGQEELSSKDRRLAEKLHFQYISVLNRMGLREQCEEPMERILKAVREA